MKILFILSNLHKDLDKEAEILNCDIYDSDDEDEQKEKDKLFLWNTAEIFDVINEEFLMNPEITTNHVPNRFKYCALELLDLNNIERRRELVMKLNINEKSVYNIVTILYEI